MERKEGDPKKEGVVVGLLEVKMRTRRRMKMWALVEAKGMTVWTISMIKTMETNE